jgi:hypothetical protein
MIMKKLFPAIFFLLSNGIIYSQSIDDIISNYNRANKFDRITGLKTIHISAKTSMMGFNIPMEIWMKNPDKVKSVTNINGQEMIQVYDGKTGYLINPVTGSEIPVLMTADQLRSVSRINLFNNYLAGYLKEGKLSLEGEETVNNKQAFKMKVSLDELNSLLIFIDRESYLILKTVTEINQGGMAISVETIPSDYTEINGILLPMKTTTSTGGMELVTLFTKIEVDVPVEDSFFKVK